MSSYAEKLSKLNSDIDGSIVSAFVSDDGLVVEQKGDSKKIDIEFLSANFAFIVKKLRNKENDLVELIVTFENYIVLVKKFEDGFLCMAMTLEANLGRAKLELKRFGKVFVGG